MELFCINLMTYMEKGEYRWKEKKNTLVEGEVQ